MESQRATHTDAGEPLGDLLRALFEAMPPPSTRKLSEPWQRLLAFYHQPAYRFRADLPGGLASLTRCSDGARIVFDGERADRVREAFAKCDTGAPVTDAGVGVATFCEEIAADLFEADAKRDAGPGVYSIDVRVYATAYIRAASEAEATALAMAGDGMELREDRHNDPPIVGDQFDDPDLPALSLSPAMTIHGVDPGTRPELVESAHD
jgi:hypothetical protein